jgi:dipeptidyl aminopeptidase/acylaminoacyl peptidase
MRKSRDLAPGRDFMLNAEAEIGGFMLRFIGLLAGTAAFAVAGSASAASRSLAEDAKAFGARESVRSVDVSPGGTKLMFIAAGPGAMAMVQYVDITSKKATTVAASTGDPETLYWCGFRSDTMMVCKYGGYGRLDNDIIGFSRIVAVSGNGGKPRQLGQPENFYNPVLRQYDGDILDWLPDQPGSVLMARAYAAERERAGSHIRDTREGLAIDRVDLDTLKSTRIESGRRDASGYMTDGRGNVRIMEAPVVQGEEEEMTGRMRFKYRLNGSKEWKDLAEFNVEDKSGGYPVAVEAQSNSVFVIKRLNGRDALYRVSLDGSGAASLVASNNAVDIDNVVRIGRGQRVIGYTYATEGRHVVYFDPEFDKLSSSLSKALPGHPAINFDGASADGSKLVVLASSDTNPGTFYLFDKNTHHLDEIAPVRPELAGRTLAEVKPVQIPASGGVQIPGYLTLPPGGTGKNLPAVVLPHGGPSARDEWGFDWLAQFLAARGYAVIQPNYRGSAGYGEQWEGANGFKDWETAVGDITASARYLVNQGIADPNRLAILGWSYGGYAALQSAAVQPDLYKAAVAIAPVTDLSLLKAQSANFTNRQIVENFVGQGPNVAAGSPAKRADAIRAPVLLVHGDLDANVGIQHSERMLAALQGAGKKAELLRFKGLDHQLDDSNARAQMLTRIGQFLDSAIGH